MSKKWKINKIYFILDELITTKDLKQTYLNLYNKFVITNESLDCFSKAVLLNRSIYRLGH